jgi:hypothetical protein
MLLWDSMAQSAVTLKCVVTPGIGVLLYFKPEVYLIAEYKKNSVRAAQKTHTASVVRPVG